MAVDWPTPDEVAQLARATAHLDTSTARLHVAENSPWLSLDVWAFDAEGAGVQKYALWRHTGDVYKLDEQGAAPDDPILKGARDADTP